MARVLIDAIQPQVKGAGLVLNATITFYGLDVPNGSDTTAITIPLPGTMNKPTWRNEITAAISAEAARLGYAFRGEITHLSELFQGL